MGSRNSGLLLPLLFAVFLIAGLVGDVYAGTEGGVVRAGSAQIVEQGNTTLIQQSSHRAVIDWRGFGIGANEQVKFAQPSASSATLNRVTGSQVSVILGRMDANGQVLLINPNGIIFGKGAQINVGSLIASTANISDGNFMEGRLLFDQPGRPGAGIVNAGGITASEGGLIALVAPHVRNDGVIQAKLGKVLIGAADTFTIDLYGDGLINLALSEASLDKLRSADGEPVKSLITQTGTIAVNGGQAVLVTAGAAKDMLDSLINMSGVILAESAVQEGGRILLLAKGGGVDVSGDLSAAGMKGGRIEVLGDKVHLASTATLDADGTYGGGTLHIGGAYQGGGDTYRSLGTEIDPGAILKASALYQGNGGEVVVWSDYHTAYAGGIYARGGSEGGYGGIVEVSGKQTLDFSGMVDAGADNGRAGSLLLDPYNFYVGMAEASLINRVLRTGTSTSVSADNNIYVNYLIDGRGRYAGGGLTLNAGNGIQVNEHIVTNNGAINLYAGTGSVNLASGKVVYAGAAPITVRSGADLYNAPYITGGLLSLISTGGSVHIDQGIDPSIGNLFLQAAVDVDVNEPIVSLNDGNSVTINAGNDINVNDQIDGRPALGSSPNGTVTMTAGQDIDLNRSIIANTINLAASLGTINAPTMKAGTVTLDVEGTPLGEGLFAGNGSISVTSGGTLSSGIYVSTGPVLIRSTGGDVDVDTKLAEILGDTTIKSDAGSVNVDHEIANIRSGSNLTIEAGSNINLNRQIDALDDTNPLSIAPVPGGGIAFTAGNNVNLNKDLVTFNGPVDIRVTNGTLNIGWDAADSRTNRIQAGTAPITVSTGGDLSTGTAPPATFVRDEVQYPTVNDNIVGELKRYVAFNTTGKLSLSSTGGDVTVDAPIPDTTGEVELTAGDAIVVNHKVLSNNQPVTLTAGTGGITVNSTDDTYGIGSGQTPSIDSGTGNLNLISAGHISISMQNKVATAGKLTIDTRGRIIQGSVNGLYSPSEIELTADGGIDYFEAWCSPKISATSSDGAIHIDVYLPGQLIINAPSPVAGDVFTGGFVGNDVRIFAGRDINLSKVYKSGVLILDAGRDANLEAFNVQSLDVTAVGNVYFASSGLASPDPTIWLRGGDLSVRSTGGDIEFGSPSDYSAVHINGTGNITVEASDSVSLGLIETLGPVNITAGTGGILLRNDIGPSVQFYSPSTSQYYTFYDQGALEMTYRPSPYYYPGRPAFDSAGTGVASLALNSGGNINMQGAKASGTVAITAGGGLTPAKGIFSGTQNGVTINAAGGALEKFFGGDVNHTGPFSFTGSSFGDIPIAVQIELKYLEDGTAVISPGPNVDPPGLPDALTALPALPPGLVGVAGTGLPAETGGGDSELAEIEVEPVRVEGNAGLGEIIPDGLENADEEELRKGILRFAGGRGVGQTTDFGRR
jgi:filamentous hemagglutinin family protein